MGKIDLPYVERNIAKGRIYYRYRRDGQRIALPTDPTSPEFSAAYKQIHDGFENNDKETNKWDIPGSIAALVTNYKASSEYLGLSPETKRGYARYLDDIKEKLGKFPVKNLTRNIALNYRDSMAIHKSIDEDGKEQTTFTNATANYAMAVLRKLLSFAVDHGTITVNHALRPKKLKVGEHAPWGEKEITRFLEVADERMKRALILAVCTGQRQGDILKMLWNQRDAKGIEVVQEKTGAKVWIPIHPILRTALNDAPKTSVYIMASKNGCPYQGDHFRHEWRETTLAAGLNGFVFHGLRKTATVFLAEAGCSNEQIKSITGHKTDIMVSHYAAGAKQKKLATSAMRLVEKNCPTHFLKTAQLSKKQSKN